MEGETVTMQDVFLFYDEGDNEDGKIKGYHGPTGICPSYDAAPKQHGFNLLGSLFMKTRRPGA